MIRRSPATTIGVAFAAALLVGIALPASASPPYETEPGPDLRPPSRPPGISDILRDARPTAPGEPNRAPTEQEIARKKAELEAEKTKLDAEVKEQEGKIEARKKKFLDSKDGKDARKEVEKEAKERDKKIDDLIKERNRKQGVNCCGLGERQEIGWWFHIESNKINDDYNEKEKKIVEDALKKKDPKAFKDNEKDKKALKKLKSKTSKVAKTLEQIEEAEREPLVEP